MALILAGLLFLFAYILLAAVKPLHRCSRCRGQRVVRRGQFRACPKCKGRGRTMRPGAALVHRLLHDHIGPWVRDRIRPVRDEEQD